MSKLKIFRSNSSLAVVLALCVCVPMAAAQDNDVPAWRLPITPSVAAPEDGHYFADDDVEFWVDHQGDGENARLRFVGNDEIFYLTSDPSTLGGRVLKYDTGDVALAVSSWGGVTLYTRNRPNGIPAERMGEAPDLDPAPVRPGQLQDLALEIVDGLEDRENLDIGFAANWERIARGNRVRALTIDSFRNASNALAELASTTQNRAAHAERIRMVRIVLSNTPTVEVRGETVTIAIDANGELWERPSSRAIIEAIENSQ